MRAWMIGAGLALVLGAAACGQGGEAASAIPGADGPAYLQSLYRHLHENPELSFHEIETAKRIAEEWRKAGFEVTEGVGRTGIVGVMKNGEGPVVMLRTDLDALPVAEKTGLAFASKAMGVTEAGAESPVMHACGHDVHMTVLVGTARRLAAMKDQWSGTLVLVGQPAEELGKGARAMLEDGLFERFPTPDYALALHVAADLPAGTVGYASGYALANVDSVDIRIPGVGGHGAYPHKTKDPVVLAAQIVLALQTLVSRETSPLDSAVVTVGSIHGGSKHNIIPDEVRLQLTVRSYTDETRDRLLAGIERIAVNTARAAGMAEDALPEVTVKDEFTPSTYNDPALAERAIAAIAAKLGGDKVVVVDPVMGGEDFSRYGRTSEDVPAFIFWNGAAEQSRYAAAKAKGEALPSLHSPFFAPDAETAIATGVDAMTAAALDLLAAPD